MRTNLHPEAAPLSQTFSGEEPFEIVDLAAHVVGLSALRVSHDATDWKRIDVQDNPGLQVSVFLSKYIGTRFRIWYEDGAEDLARKLDHVLRLL